MKVIKYIIRRLVIYLLFVLSAILYPHRVYGRKNIPKDIPFLIYGNHISIIDPVFIVTAFISRDVYFMGKEELFKNRALNWFFRAIGGFPVRRGRADMVAIRECVKHIKDGDLMVIFPEGTRNKGDFGNLQQFHNGASLVIHNAKSPALPVYIENKRRMGLFSFTKIHIGKLVDMSEYTNEKLSSDNLNAITVRLKDEMENLMKNSQEL